MPILRLSIALILFTLAGVAQSQSLKGEAFAFYGEEQPLTDVLTAIATHARMGVRVNEDIDVVFSGHLKQRNAQEALNYLAASYDLVWYSDGSTLYVDPINALETRMFHLNQITARQLKATMRNLSIWDGRFEWRSLARQSILMVSGPPRYLSLVDETILLLNEQGIAASRDSLDVTIFKLRHASAADRTVTVRGEQTTLPGVATLLQGLLAQGSEEQSQESPLPVSDDTDSQQQNDKDKTKKHSGAAAQGGLNKTRAQGQGPRFKGAPHPQAAIYADPSNNAVIVQDYSSRLVLYESVIAELDAKKEQLEISLLIIDLTTSSLRDLGVDWTVKSRLNGRGLLDLVLPGASETAATNLAQTNADFLATVSALESQGEARVSARPAVVTEDGIEALLDNNETFFVRVQGERVASLEEITFGTLLQVTPRIVEADVSAAGAASFINLDVRIEDASRLADGSVDALPTIRNTQISTRSSVPDGGSLLIGGYYREATTSNRNGVPVLGKLPLLSGFFSHTGDSTSQLVRLFMLSPRILTDSVFNSVPSGGDQQPLPHDQRIRQLADLSNFNPEINRLRHQGQCESAINARQRRNNYRKSNIATRIIPCERATETYRVVPL